MFGAYSGATIRSGGQGWGVSGSMNLYTVRHGQTAVIRKNSVPHEISANVRDRSESDPGATESVVGPAVIAYPLET
jgi:hypothetical protein